MKLVAIIAVVVVLMGGVLTVRDACDRGQCLAALGLKAPPGAR
ncbi:hypothetical protein ACN8ZM_40205 (plasmid) [Burkholderia aenigmatica]